MFGKLVAAGLGLFGLYEGYTRWYQPTYGSFTVTSLDAIAVTVSYTGSSGGQTPAVSAVQAALDSVLPGQFSVTSAQANDTSHTLTFAANVLGPSMSVPSKDFVGGLASALGSAYGTFSLVSVTDTGPMPAPAGAPAGGSYTGGGGYTGGGYTGG